MIIGLRGDAFTSELVGPSPRRVGAEITPAKLRTLGDTARKRLRGPNGGYRRDHLRALAQRVEVAEGEVRIMGSRSALLRTLAASSSAKSAAAGVPAILPKWR
jgi:hypothetical protein